MSQTERIVKMLGGEKTLGRRVSSSAELISILREGLRYRSLEEMIKLLHISREQLVTSLALSSRTIARRKEEDRLSSEESDRVFRLAQIAARAEEVLGSRDKVQRWLMQPNRALGDCTPLSMLDTHEGTRQVEAVLGRIEHGVFS